MASKKKEELLQPEVQTQAQPAAQSTYSAEGLNSRADVEKAMEPLFTTGNPEERSGLGFAVMQSFMDKVKVSSQPGKGTRVVLTKRLDERST